MIIKYLCAFCQNSLPRIFSENGRTPVRMYLFVLLTNIGQTDVTRYRIELIYVSVVNIVHFGLYVITQI